MKRNLPSESGVFTGRAALACLFCSIGASLALLSFAGSFANPSTSTAPPGFHAPVTVPASSGGDEPSLALNKNGIRYVSWQVPGDFASSADGVNFTHLTVPDSSGGGDVNNQVSYSGALYNVQICGNVTTMLHSCLYRSLDGGQTWSTQNTLADNNPGASDRPWIDVYPKGNTTPTASDPNHDVIYLEYHTFSPDDLVYVTKSTDGGATFGPPIPVEQGTNATDSTCNTLPGNIIIDQATGEVYALWISGDDVAVNLATGCNYSEIGPFPKAWVSRSIDGGTTWTPVLAFHGAFDPTTNIGDDTSKGFATISEDSSGQIHIGLSVRHNDDPRTYFIDCQTNANCLEEPTPTDFYLLTSPDRGAHWTLPFKVNQTVGSFFYPWIAAGSAGNVLAAYYSSTTLRPNDPTSVWYVGSSRVTDAIAQYTTGANASYVSSPLASPEVLLDPNRVHGNGSTGGGICTFGLSCAIVPGSNRNLGDVFEIHLDPAGGANVTWTSDNGGNHIGFACQNSGASAIAGAPDLIGCYGPADMSIAMTNSSSSIPPGGTLTYHLSVTNNGMPTMPSTTSGVTVSDVLPPGVTFVSATPSTGRCSGTSTVTCDLGIFPSGATATIDIVVTANTCNSITNTATVAALTNDPVPANNSATVTTSISALAPPIAVSRKTHGTAGTYDIDLPLAGPSPAGIECRSGGASGVHQVVITFPAPSITVTNATVTPGPGGTASIVLAPGHQPPNEVVATLSNVSNAQTLTINLLGVSDGCTTADLHIPMSVLLGDVNASGLVDSGDVFLVRQQTSQTTNAFNFRRDVNASGLIDSGDVFITRQQTSTSLPTPP